MNRYIRKLSIFAAILSLCACSSPNTGTDTNTDSNTTDNTQQTAAVTELKLAEMHFEGYPTVDACIYFADSVKEKTDGRVNITVYADGELGSENEAIEKTISGEISIARVNSNPLSAYSPAVTPVVMPYVMRSRDHLTKVMNGEIGNKILSGLDNGLKGLCWYYSGARSFYSTKPITSLADLKGMVIRVQNSPIMQDMITYLGGTPVVMDWQDMYDKFDNKTLDAGENDLTSYQSFAHDIIAPNYTFDEHVYAPSILIMNKEALDKLSPQDRDIVKECAKLSQEYEDKLWTEYENKCKEQLVADGVNFIELSPEEKEKIAQACQPLYEKYAADYIETIDKIKTIQ